MDAWAEALEAQRKRYIDMVEEYKRQSNVKALDPNKCNPLARTPDNPFNQLHVNDELLREIWKDVERTFSEVELVNGPESRKMLQRILFHWCRVANPSKTASDSYRQGMNELAAVALACAKACEYEEQSWETTEAIGLRLCGKQHTEADAFLLFSKLMELGLRPMFMPSSSPSPSARAAAQSSPIGELPRSRTAAGGVPPPPSSAILARCVYIFDTIVQATDPGLHAHLRRQEIEPQVFLLRWLRLLFCREYSLEEVLHLWDGLFYDAFKPALAPADVPLKYPTSSPGGAEAEWREAAAAAAALPLLDYMAAAFLRSMRGELLGLDQTDCLRRLLAARPAVSTSALLTSAHKLRLTSSSEPSPAASGGAGPGVSSPAISSPLSPASQAPPRSGAGGGYPSERSAAPVAAGVAGQPLRGNQFFNVAAQGAQGFFSAATQVVATASQKLSESLPVSNGEFGGGSYVEQLQRRVALAEQERDTIKKKANEFVVAKKQEWAAKVGALEAQIAARDARISDLEARLAEAERRLEAGAGVQHPLAGEAIARVNGVDLPDEAALEVLYDDLHDGGAGAGDALEPEFYQARAGSGPLVAAAAFACSHVGDGVDLPDEDALEALYGDVHAGGAGGGHAGAAEFHQSAAQRPADPVELSGAAD